MISGPCGCVSTLKDSLSEGLALCEHQEENNKTKCQSQQSFFLLQVKPLKKNMFVVPEATSGKTGANAVRMMQKKKSQVSTFRSFLFVKLCETTEKQIPILGSIPEPLVMTYLICNHVEMCRRPVIRIDGFSACALAVCTHLAPCRACSSVNRQSFCWHNAKHETPGFCFPGTTDVNNSVPT